MKKLVLLDNGSALPYDGLSLNPGPVQDRQKIESVMPGVREHGLFVRPTEAFGALWPQVVALGCDGLLSCDVPLIAPEGQAPAWLAGSGPPLAAHLAAMVAGWGPYAAQGRWTAWLKNRMDRKTIALYQRT